MNNINKRQCEQADVVDILTLKKNTNSNNRYFAQKWVSLKSQIRHILGQSDPLFAKSNIPAQQHLKKKDIRK